MTKEETKKMLRLTKRLDERKKKDKQNQLDAQYITDIRHWVYPENKKHNNNTGV
jgi:hypothetical protein